MGSNPATPTIERVMMTSQLSLLYTTFATEADALFVSKQLLQSRLIACANILAKVTSLYFWEEELQETAEVAVLLKTTTDILPELLNILKELHPYEIPMILEIPIAHANNAFVEWVEKKVR